MIRADVNTLHYYYPFGSIMPGRSYNSGDYRYSFNGYEKDLDLNDNGNTLDFGARIYDSRVGKFLSIDPRWREFTSWSTYLFAADNPIVFVDVNGEGPGDKCTDCGDPSKLDVGTTHTTSTNNYTINYVVKEDNGRKFWDISSAKLEEGTLSKLSTDEAENIRKEFFDLTSYIKVGKAVGTTFTQKAKDLFDDDIIFSFEVPENEKDLTGIVLDVLSPFDSDANYTFNVDKEGFIHMSDFQLYYKAGVASGAKALLKAYKMGSLKGLKYSKLVKNKEIFKNDNLRNFLTKYFRENKAGLSVGNGGSAAALKVEAETGVLLSQTGHYQKVLGAKKYFLKVLGGKMGNLTNIEKQFLIRELIDINRALEIAKTSSKYVGKF